VIEKEKEIQKALGTFPTFECNQCHKEYFIDEKFTYTNVGGAVKQLCTICATAQFVCNRLFKKPMGEFTKEDE